MSYIKKAMICAAAAGAVTLVNATPVVSNVTMTQGLANRQVTITYSVSEDAVVTLDVQTNATPNAATGWVSIGGAAICNAKGDVWKKVEAGSRTITWRPDLSWTDENGNGFNIANGCAKAIVTAYALDNTPDYMVVDISAAAQPNTQKYYPGAEYIPGGILGNTNYRMGMMLMRKIMAKDITWMMGSTTIETSNVRNATREATHQVTLTNNFYIGVFEVTQTQWGLVATNSSQRANFTAEAAMRPMEKVCYNEIRNAVNSTTADPNYNYPNPPKGGSFLDLLRTKTGIDFDLPTEAQWEYAARAGNGSGYWNDGSAMKNADPDANLDKLGRYSKNNPGGISATTTLAPDAGGTAIAGSYGPNSWGLYDMHGNVWEWCLDWISDNITGIGGMVNIDPSSPANTLTGKAGSQRILRGGGWNLPMGYIRPAYRNSSVPTYRDSGNGFRVVCTAGLK